MTSDKPTRSLTSPARRRFLGTAAGIGLVTVSGVSMGAAQESIDINHTGTTIHYQPTDWNGVRYRMSIDVEVNGPLAFSGDAETAIRVTNEATGAELDIIPQQAFEDVERISLQNVYDNNGTLRPEDDSLAILPADGDFDFDVPFSIEGDEDTFAGGGVFSTYTVTIMADGVPVASTDGRLLGIGYERATIEQSGTTGEIDLTLPLETPFDESWHVEFEMWQIGPEDHHFETDRMPVENNGDTLEWTLDVSDVEPGEYDHWHVYAFPDQTETDFPDMIAWMHGYDGVGGDDIVVDEDSGDDQSGTISGDISFTDDLLTEPVANLVMVELTADGLDDQASEEVLIDATSETSPVGYAIDSLATDEYNVTADVVAVDGDLSRADEVAIAPSNGPYESVPVGANETTSGIDFDLEKVSDTDEAVADYTNDEGVVEISGLRDAIDDWRGGDLNITQLRDVIDAWRSGTPVE